MKKLILWGVMATLWCVMAYFIGLFIGLPLSLAIYFPTVIIGIVVMFTAITVGKNVIFTAVAPIFSATLLVVAFSTEIVLCIILSITSILIFAGSAVVAKVVIATEKIKVKYGRILLLLLAEWIIVFIVLKYGYLLLPR